MDLIEKVSWWSLCIGVVAFVVSISLFLSVVEIRNEVEKLKIEYHNRQIEQFDLSPEGVPGYQNLKVIQLKDLITDTLYEQALDSLKEWEGWRSKIYHDVDGTKTIGYGHQLLRGENFTEICEYQGDSILRCDFYERYSWCTRYNLKHNETLALAMLGFNLGLGKLDEYVEKYNLINNPERMLGWIYFYKDGEKVRSKWQERRREGEYSMYVLND